jgi:hypothetical protein
MKFNELYESYIKEDYQEELINQFKIKKKEKEYFDNPEDGIEVNKQYYNIIHKGKIVGELYDNDYVAGIYGDLYGKELPNLKHYGPGTTIKKMKLTLRNFLKSKLGKIWAKNVKELKDIIK